jgi:serine/threonine protein kinase
VATQQDLDLARRLLRAAILDEDEIRGAFALQARLVEQGKRARIEQVIYAQKLLPKGSLAPLSLPPLLEAQPFSEYRLDDVAGVGGMGAVYRGTYLPNGAPVAVKVLDPVQALRADFRDRFVREANLHCELEHENIVRGYEYVSESGLHFYSMDFVEGATVLEIVERRGFLSNEEALSILVQVAAALSYLHDMGMIHRDIKPGNIMVDENGWARLIDLGLVGKMGSPGGAQKESVTTVGTVEYLSPEQARGRNDLDARADLYSLGIALYHMVVGEVPFQGDSDYEVMAKQILSRVDAQKIKQRRITPEIYFLIAKLAAKDRDERLRDAEEARRIIQGYLPGGIVPIDLGPLPEAKPVAAPDPRPAGGGDAPIRSGRRGTTSPRHRRRRR